MKICMITPDSYMIDRRIILEAASLVKAGHSVTLLAGFECRQEEQYEQEGISIKRFVYDWDDSRLKKIRKKLADNDRLKMMVNRSFMAVARKLFYISPFEMFMVDKLMEEEADVIHVHDLPCLKAGEYAARKKGVPLIFDAHEIYYAQDVLTQAQQSMYYKLEKRLIKKCTHVITVNPFIAELMAKRYRVRPPHVVMNCTFLDENIPVYQENDIIRKSYGLNPEDRVVLYQGWISPERNIDKLVKSVEFLPKHIYLAVVGYGDYVKELEKICAEKGIADRVFFVGQVPNERIMEYTAAADLGVIPYEPIDENHLYCSPNKLFEYIVGELPFICNDLPFLRQVREEYGVLETTVMKDEQQIAATIQEILTDAERLEMLKNNCKKAKTQLNWEIESQKVLEIYRSLR